VPKFLTEKTLINKESTTRNYPLKEQTLSVKKNLMLLKGTIQAFYKNKNSKINKSRRKGRSRNRTRKVK
jgi:hypothetical protein